MTKILNITNGDSAMHVMCEAGVLGEILPWRDVLHDGPVPADLTLSELSAVRAEFIANQGWANKDSVAAGFKERDQILSNFRAYDKIVLWFEHDLYDQLQILQILDWFAQQADDSTPLTMICTENYLGEIDAKQLQALARYEQLVTSDQLQLAQRAWLAFRASIPERWNELLSMDTSTLPFLNGAVLRWLEEFPNTRHGLSLTAFEIMDIVVSNDGILPGRLFQEYQLREQRRFMGDLSFFDRLKDLCASEQPLLMCSDRAKLIWPPNGEQPLSVTPLGEQLIHGNYSLSVEEIPSRWMGGTYLEATDMWWWNNQTQTISQHREGRGI